MEHEVPAAATVEVEPLQDSQRAAKGAADADQQGPVGRALQTGNPARVLLEGQAVRIAGIKGRTLLNGTEGVLGTHDTGSDRWVFKSGSEALRIRPCNLECVGKSTKQVLRHAFRKAAERFQYHSKFMTNDVFDRLYDFAASQGQPGVGMFFRDLCQHEQIFDQWYARMGPSTSSTS